MKIEAELMNKIVRQFVFASALLLATGAVSLSEINTAHAQESDNTPPSITSPGRVNHRENRDAVTSFTATDAESDTITWEITGGADMGVFNLSTSGLLSITNAPDFEAPADADKNGIYEITITATDDGTPSASSTLDVTILVINDEETGTIGAITGIAQVGQTLTAGTVTDPDGSVAVTGYEWQDASDNSAISGATAATYTLAEADAGKTIQVVVTYTDGHSAGEMLTSLPTWTVAAAGATLSADANLASLTISAGNLSPPLNATTINYAVSVGNDVASTTVTPAVNAAASVTVAGTTVASGTASEAIDLTVGINAIVILVTAQDGTEKTYTVTVTRAIGISNLDGESGVSIKDAKFLYYAHALGPALNDSNQATVLGPLTSAEDSELDNLLTAAKGLLSDLNGDGDIDDEDAAVLYYSFALEGALGNGDTKPGLPDIKRAILGPLAVTNDMDAINAMLQRVYEQRGP